MEDNEIYDVPRISFWKKMRFLIPAYTMMWIGRIILWLFEIIRWLFMPIALVLELLIVFPLSKFTFKLNNHAAFKEIAETKLHEYAWKYFAESRAHFEREGFEMGKYVFNNSIFPDQELYTMTMVNHAEGIGVGFIYIRMVKAKDEMLDVSACEFTCVVDEVFYDLTNNPQSEPFLPLPGRHRLILDEYSDTNLLQVMREFQSRKGCRSNSKMLELIQNNPRVILNDEIRMMKQANIERRYMSFDEANDTFRLTWKGAFIATFQSLWPYSDIYKDKLRKSAKEFLSELDINADETAYADEDLEPVSIAEAVTTIAAAMLLVTPHAKKAGFDSGPSVIEVLLTTEEETPEVQSFEVRYESFEDFPERETYRQLSYAYYIDNENGDAYEMERDDYMMSYAEFDEYEMEKNNRPALPIDFSVNEDYSGILLSISTNLDIAKDSIEGAHFSLEVDDEQPVWKVTLFANDDEKRVLIDAVSGKFLRLLPGEEY